MSDSDRKKRSGKLLFDAIDLSSTKPYKHDLVRALTIFLLCAATSLSMIAFHAARSQTQKLADAAREILATQQEPKRSIERIGILAALLGPENSLSPILRSKPNAALRALLPQHCELDATKAQANSSMPPHVHAILTQFSATVEQALHEAAGSRSHQPQPAIPRSSDRFMQSYLETNNDIVEACRSTTAKTMSLGRGPGLCARNKAKSYIVFVPPPIVDALETLSQQALPPGFLKALVAAQQIDTMVFPPQECAQIAQAYFVTPEGFFAQTAQQKEMLNFAPNRPLWRWDAASYFDSFLANEDQIFETTQSYLDISGLGLVKTYCVRINDVELPSLTIGAFCVDEQIDTARFNTRKNDLFSYESFGLSFDGSGKLSSAPVAEAPSEAARRAAKHLATKMTAQDFSDKIERISEDEFIVPLARGPSLPGEPGIFSVILVSTELPPKHYIDVLILAGVSAGFALFGLIKLVRAAGEELERNQRATLLRNLQVGVLETDENDCIIRGNDRAEEILGIALNRFGQSRDDASVATKVFALVKDLEGIEGAAHCAHGPIETVRAIRDQGRSSVYTATVIKTEKRIRISGSPMGSPDYDPKRPGMKTFGIIEPVDESER